jgi:hypothetical protein
MMQSKNKTTKMNERKKKPANRTGNTSEGNIEKRKK